MLNFFRKIRHSLLSQDKTGKPVNQAGRYFKYAVGEIILVVLGILIALSINNWNEKRKESSLTKTYRLKLIEELNSDIENLTFLDSMNTIYSSRILQHFKKNEARKQKIALPIIQSQNNYLIARFYSKTYSINTLLGTGELSLFRDSEKQNIIELKEALDRYNFYEETEIETVNADFRSIKNEFDLLAAYGYSRDIENQELTDKQYSKYKNFMAELLKLYNMQSRIYEMIKSLSAELVMLLQEKKV